MRRDVQWTVFRELTAFTRLWPILPFSLAAGNVKNVHPINFPTKLINTDATDVEATKPRMKIELGAEMWKSST